MPKQRTLVRVAPQGFVVAPVEYDITNDYQTRGAGLTGAADTKQITVSGCLNFSSLTGAQEIISTATTVGGSSGPRVRLRKDPSTNVLRLIAANAAGTDILSILTVSAAVVGVWTHFLASVDLADPAKRHLYLNDVSDLSGTVTHVDDAIDFTTGDWGIGARPNGASKFGGCLGELFMHNTYIDLSIIANRRLFRSQYGRPIYLGADGSRPLGVQPLIYMPDGKTNLGAGGTFTETGATTACASAP